MGIGEKFKKFCDNLKIDNISSISTRYKRITKQLNWDIRGVDSDKYNSMYVGSYGRDTAICGFSDLDMVYILPQSLYTRFNSYQTNGQSALLQEIRKSIAKTYPTTKIGADGQVVVINFSDGMCFEIVPVFENTDRSFTFPNANNGGSWKKTNPRPEIDIIASANHTFNYNLKRLSRMTRSWKNTWSVPMGGLLIDTLAYNFISTWEYKKNSFFFYDWLTRDFFKYLSESNTNQTLWYAVGSNQHILRKGNFESSAKKCYKLALEAIEYEEKGMNWSANQKWREIYGTAFPNI